VQVIEGRVEVATRDGGASFMVMPGDIGSVSATAPGRLNLQGRESRSINSSTPSAAVAAVTASLEDSADKTPDVDQARFDGAIVAPVGEGPVNLEAMSDGMVKGNSSMMAMVSMMAESSRDAKPTEPSTDRAPTTSTVTNNTTAVDVAPGAITPPETVEVPLPPVPVDVAQAGGKPAPASLPPVGVINAPPVDDVFVALPPTPAPVVVAALPPQEMSPVVIPANAGNGNNGGSGNAFGNAGGTGNGTGNSNGSNGNGNGNGNNGNRIGNSKN
jgi:hypothetical protein